MLNDIIADDIAQTISIPILRPGSPVAARTGIASGLRAHPTGLALLISEQAFQKQACIPRNTILIEQRTYPFLDLTKRRRHSASVSSIDAGRVHDLRIMVAHGFRKLHKRQL